MPGSAAQKERRGEIAAQSIFAASAAVNAIPVAGQFASAGLAIAGLMVKLFAGKKQKKKEQAEKAKEAAFVKAHNDQREAKGSGVQGADAVGGQQATQTVQATAPVNNPQSSSFGTWGGGDAPTVQTVLNNKTGV